MKKWPFLLLFTLASQLNFANSNRTIEEIDAEIAAYTEQLQAYRKEAFNDEMEAQPGMRLQWHQYVQDVEKEEGAEKKILEIKKKIEQLTQEKEEVQKNSALHE